MNDSKIGNVLYKKPANFTQVSNVGLSDKRLSWKARGLYSFLVSKATIEGWNFNREWLIGQSEKDGETSYDTGIIELKELGYLIIKRKVGKSGRFIWEWEILDFPLSLPLGDYPGMDKPAMEKPLLENRGLNNKTRSSNIDFNNTEKDLPKQKSASDVRIKPLIAWYTDFYQKVFHVKPTIHGEKLGSLLKQRLKALDSEGYEPEASTVELRRIVSTIITGAAKGVAKYPFDGKTSLELVLAGNIWDAARRELGQGKKKVEPEVERKLNPNIGCLEGRKLGGQVIKETYTHQTED